MATTTEKEIKVSDGLGNADASQVMAGATFSSESGFNQEGKFSPNAENINYDNTESGLSAENVQSAIDELAGNTITGTLSTGSTSITLSDSSITTDSTIDIYTSIYGVNPKSVTVETGSVTLTFDAQTEDVNVKVVIK